MHERMMDKTIQPTHEDMINWIGQPIAGEWIALQRFLTDTYGIVPIFNSGGKRYGWNLQYRIGGRPLCEIYPEHGSFTMSLSLFSSPFLPSRTPKAGRKPLDSSSRTISMIG